MSSSETKTPTANPVHEANLEAYHKQRILELALLGVSIKDMASRLLVTEHFVKKVLKSQEFKDMLKALGDEAVLRAKQTLKANTESVANEVWLAFRRLLKSDSGRDVAEALKLYFRLIGLEDNASDASSAPITIQFPGLKTEKVIEVGSAQPSEKDDEK